MSDLIGSHLSRNEAQSHLDTLWTRSMRIAIGIVGLIFMGLTCAHSCAAFFGGSIFGEESLSQGGAVGILAGVLFGVGGAFAFKLPKVSIGIFAVVAVLGLVVGLATVYSDMIFYGIIAVILLILSVVAHKRMLRESGHSSS